MIKKSISALGLRFGLDLPYFINNGGFVLASQIIEAILSLLLMAILTKLLTKEVFGGYSIVLSLISLSSITSLPGLTQSVARSVSKGLGINLLYPLKQAIKFSLLGSSGMILFAIFFFTRGQIDLVWSLLAASIFLPFIYSFNNVWGGFTLGQKRFDKLFLFTVLNSITMVLVMAAVALTKPNIISLSVGFLIATLIPNTLIFFWQARKTFHLKSIGSEANAYGLFLTKINILNSVATYVDQISIGLLLNSASAGSYRVASSLANVIKNFEKSGANLILTRLAIYQGADVLNKIKKIAIPISILSLTMIGITMVFQPIIIPSLFSIKYVDAIGPGQIILFSIAFVPLEILVSQYFVAFGLKTAIKISSTIIPLGKISITLLFIIFGGYYGVVVSNIFTRLLNIGVYLFIIFQKRHND